MKTKYKIKVGFFAVIMLLTLIITSPEYFPALVCSVTVHELGHILAAKIKGIKLSKLKLGILGASLFPKDQLFSYGNEIFLCLGGPLMNFISVAVCIVLKLSSSSFFLMSSLALGTLNMLPIHGFDGGRILSAFLHMRLSFQRAEQIAKIVSFVFLFSLWCLSVYFLLRRTATLSLFVFSASVFAKIFISEDI